MMVAPAIGDIVRPSVPPSVAMLPIWTCDMPKSGAYGVMASLKANVAASPEPVKRPSRNGPKAAQILTIAGLLSIASMNHLTRPIDVRPATKTPAEMMMPMMLPYALPIPSKNASQSAFGFVRVTTSVRRAPMIMACGTPILKIGTIFVEPSNKMTIGTTGISA